MWCVTKAGVACRLAWCLVLCGEWMCRFYEMCGVVSKGGVACRLAWSLESWCEWMCR